MPQADDADETLVAKAQRGDAGAFGLLVERYQDALFNGIYRMVGHREEAEDLTQEALVKAHSGIQRFEGRSAFYTWLYSIAHNVVISYRRKTGSRRHLNPLSLHEGHGDRGHGFDVLDGSQNPAAAAEQHELQGRIEEAIAQLDDEYRVVVVMRDIEGFDYQTIARLLGCPHGTVKSRLHRARLALREQLKDLVV